MERLKRWLYAIFFIISSVLLVSMAYDIEKGTLMEEPSTQVWFFELLTAMAGVLGVWGSIVVAGLVTSLSLYTAISQHFKKNI